LTIDHFVQGSDPIRLSMMQFLFCATVLLPVSLILGRPTLEGVAYAFPFVLYLGILSCGVAFTLQVVGQKYAAPAIACLLLSLESVFGVIGGALILGERMGTFEILGAATVFGAIIFSQIADLLREKRRQKHLKEIGETSEI
jgi:drug/metabolite transporter (DMT)-like permease